MWLVLVPASLGVLLLKYVADMEDSFSHVRLLYGLGYGIVISLIVVRLVTNAVILRMRCREAIVDWNRGEAEKVPVDPTISFLGTDWWKLPAMIGVSLASIWALLEFTGLSKLIVILVQSSP
jgi:hypothetical protein